MKKSFLSLLVVLVLFNVLNIIDKVTTYIGMNMGFGELNKQVVFLFSQYGLLLTSVLQIVLVIGCSIIFYGLIKKLSERVKIIYPISIIPLLFLIASYSGAVINNMRLIL